MGAAAEYLMNIGLDAIHAHERELTRYAMETLRREIPTIELYGPEADERGGIVAFNLPGIHPHDVAQILDQDGIAVRAGHHCAQPLHEKFGIQATSRASFYLYTTTGEVDKLVDGIYKVKKVFG